jgi:hypothetical protein
VDCQAARAGAKIAHEDIREAQGNARADLTLGGAKAT